MPYSIQKAMEIHWYPRNDDSKDDPNEPNKKTTPPRILDDPCYHVLTTRHIILVHAWPGKFLATP